MVPAAALHRPPGREALLTWLSDAVTAEAADPKTCGSKAYSLPHRLQKHDCYKELAAPENPAGLFCLAVVILLMIDVQEVDCFPSCKTLSGFTAARISKCFPLWSLLAVSVNGL